MKKTIDKKLTKEFKRAGIIMTTPASAYTYLLIHMGVTMRGLRRGINGLYNREAGSELPPYIFARDCRGF